MYKVSKEFDMNISFEELIDYNKTCKVELGTTHHFESFCGLIVYVSHPKVKEKFSIELGVTTDGIVYEGDGVAPKEAKEIPIEEGIKLLETYRVLVNSSSELEYLLVKNDLGKDIVEINMR